MHPVRAKAATVDEYISLFDGEVKSRLETLRKAIRTAAPEAEEVISYSIPAYKYHGFLIYFSAYTAHISISFPPHGIMQAFASELAPYKTSKSTVQLPLDHPLPLELVKKMVTFKMQENLQLEAAKAKMKKASTAQDHPASLG